jgi:hypothetical protein
MVPDVVELRKDQGFVEDMSRFAEGVLTEKQVRAKYHLFDESTWTALNDDAFVEAVELERTRRIRSGATKRELAQLRVVAAPDVLSGILMDPRANARHRIDASKALDDLAGFAPQAAAEQDMVQITINLGGGEVYRYGGSVKLVSGNDGWRDGKVIDAAPKQIAAEQPMEEAEVLPVKRGRGRPCGSRNKPKSSDEAKLIEQPGLPGFDVT